jgi:heptosyltransferase-2
VRLPNWLGDIVMALPALDAVRRQFRDATLAVALPAPLAPLLQAVPGVDEVVALATVTGLARVRRDTEALRAGRFDVAVLFTNSFGSALAAKRAGIPERWGYRRDARGWLLTRRVPRRAGRDDGRARHHSNHYRRLVEALGAPRADADACLRVPQAWAERAVRLLSDRGGDAARPLVGIAPGAAYGGAKRWPPGLVARLIGSLLSETDATVVLVGAPADRETGHEIESLFRAVPGDATRRAAAPDVPPAPARVVNLIGATDLPALAGLLSRLQAFVSNDSGAMHLAAAVRTHVIALFGPTDEVATAPLGPHTIVVRDVFCRPCLLRECPIDHRCMKRITPDAVHDLVVHQLQVPRL